jgi:mannose-6-phosphate isomerase-like protein (cupin superfamily)
MSGYEIVTLDELGPYASPNHGDARLIPLRSSLGLRAYGANAWTAEVGKTVVPPHEEDSGHEELYVVVRGRARFTVGDETRDAPAGTLIHVLAGTFRTATAEEPGTIVLAVAGTPGEPFQGGGWDDAIVAFAIAQEGRVDEARDLLARLGEGGDDEWGLPYNLACFEARFGDVERAWPLLQTAMSRNADEARTWARNDSDLDTLRGDPRWEEVVG